MVRRRKPNQSSGTKSTTVNRDTSSTADHLAKAVYRDLVPEHPQTCEDYGFNRAVTHEDKCNLLGLYAGLIKHMDIPPKTIHDWRVSGVLVDEIKAAYYKIPECARGSYFPWFLQNQHIVALASQPLSTEDFSDHCGAILQRSWRFTGGSERDSPEKISAAIARKPDEEQKCHRLYTFLLTMSHPSPGLDLWVDFGFASCISEEEERALGGQYHRLINACTFKEFCKAYRDRRLLDLFHVKNVQVKNDDQIRDLLATEWKKSVWDLKGYVLQEDSTGEDASVSVMLDYGFINCKNASESRRLRLVYKNYFINHRGDPLLLHEAAIRGDLYGFMSGIVQSAQGSMFRRLMRNPYPLPDEDTLPNADKLPDVDAPANVGVPGSWPAGRSPVPADLVLMSGIGGLLLGMILMWLVLAAFTVTFTMTFPVV